ncbi:Uncharacterised protein [Moraxella ovis]|uniref:Uncharacterized protein n=1 Tax=Moraxella ovis TaxID=29433 RepID=A0A378PKN3_9GAMM|nr:Uncharacterised protein [Moraxella ovis]STY87333.1 Uncharacterised protein [Moraxella ovis]STZ06894.1 Uncharacterised protein [Moraxella ovis]
MADYESLLRDTELRNKLRDKEKCILDKYNFLFKSKLCSCDDTTIHSPKRNLKNDRSAASINQSFSQTN